MRVLADELDLAPNTVAKAYRDLESAGYTVGRGRRGTFVAEVVPIPPDDVQAALDAAARSFAGRTRQLGVSQGRALATARRALRES